MMSHANHAVNPPDKPIMALDDSAVGSKFDAVLGFIREQVEKGATIEEMFRFATSQGLRLKRPPFARTSSTAKASW